MNNGKVLVIAESHAEYRRHFDLSRVKHIYLLSWDAIKGVQIDGIYLHGRWWRNPVIQQEGFAYVFSYLAAHCATKQGEFVKDYAEDFVIEVSL